MIVIYESKKEWCRRCSDEAFFPWHPGVGPSNLGMCEQTQWGAPETGVVTISGSQELQRGISGIGQGIFESFVNLWSQTGVFWCFFFECILGCGWYRSDELARAPRGFVGLFMFRTSGKATHVLATNGTKAADTKKWERYTSETNRYGMMIWHDILIFSMMYEGITKI